MKRNGVRALCWSAPAALLLLGCSGKEAAPGAMAMPPMPVETSEARRERVEDRFEAVGTVEASEAASLVFEIDGLVTALPFEEGSTVRAGQLIASLEDSELAAEVDRAGALEAQGRTAFERVKAVVDMNAGSPQQLDDAAAGLGVAEANLALARARLAKTKVVAPFDGTIGARRVSVGAFVRAGQTIAELANLDRIRVVFSAPERYLPSLRRGAPVVATTTAHPGVSFEGTILALEPVLDPTTRSGRVVASLANPERVLRPGMSAAVAATLGVREHATTIPSEAVFAGGDQSFVFVVNPDSTVVRTAVTLGSRTAEIVEVTAGLGPGATVVRAGHQKLFDGAKVVGVPSGSAGGAETVGAASGAAAPVEGGGRS